VIRARSPARTCCKTGGRQLLLVSDGATGSGLGQTVMGVYRLQDQHLVGIFEEELDFNLVLDFDEGVSEERWTTLQWGAARSSAHRPLVHANKTRTLGDLRATRSIEYEWDGRRFTNGAGTMVTPIGHAPIDGTDGSGCDARGGWYYDRDPMSGAPTKITACPATCTMLQTDLDGKVDVVLGCPTIDVG